MFHFQLGSVEVFTGRDTSRGRGREGTCSSILLCVYQLPNFLNFVRISTQSGISKKSISTTLRSNSFESRPRPAHSQGAVRDLRPGLQDDDVPAGHDLQLPGGQLPVGAAQRRHAGAEELQALYAACRLQVTSI